MHYVKPTLMELGIASFAVQSMPQGNKGIVAQDSNTAESRPSTGGCYDLDGE